MVDVDKIVENFEAKFLSMPYEKREAYLKKYGFSFEEKEPGSHVRHYIRHITSRPKTVSVVSATGLKVASRPDIAKRVISKKKTTKMTSKCGRMVRITNTKKPNNDD